MSDMLPFRELAAFLQNRLRKQRAEYRNAPKNLKPFYARQIRKTLNALRRLNPRLKRLP